MDPVHFKQDRTAGNQLAEVRLGKRGEIVFRSLTLMNEFFNCIFIL